MNITNLIFSHSNLSTYRTDLLLCKEQNGTSTDPEMGFGSRNLKPNYHTILARISGLIINRKYCRLNNRLRTLSFKNISFELSHFYDKLSTF